MKSQNLLITQWFFSRPSFYLIAAERYHMQNAVEKFETESTNDDAKDLARSGCASFTSVWAHRQTQGRGRHDRVWKSNEGSVFWSIVLRPDDSWHRHSDVIYVIALAVRESICGLINNFNDLKLKWPNDTMMHNRKLGGTLTEASGPYIKLEPHSKYMQPRWIVSGTGINVVPVDDQPGMIYPPTSLHQEGYFSADRDSIISRLVDKTRDGIAFWTKHGFEPVRDRYLEHAFGLNSRMRFGVNPAKNDYREGIYRGIDLEGAVMIEDEYGKIQKYHSGEVIKKDII